MSDNPEPDKGVRFMLQMIDYGIGCAPAIDYVMVDHYGMPPATVASFRGVQTKSVRANVERVEEKLYGDGDDDDETGNN